LVRSEVPIPLEFLVAMNQARVNRVVDWASAAFFVLAVAGLPAALISRSIGYEWPAALKIAGIVVLALVAMGFSVLLVLRIPPVQKSLVRDVDPDSKFMRLVVRLAAVQAGDPMVGSAVRKHEQEANAREEETRS